MNISKSEEEERSRERERQKLKEEIKKRLSSRRLNLSLVPSIGTSPNISPASSVRRLFYSSHSLISSCFRLFTSFCVNLKSIEMQLVIT
jgi:hypothetical protein